MRGKVNIINNLYNKFKIYETNVKDEKKLTLSLSMYVAL